MEIKEYHSSLTTLGSVVLAIEEKARAYDMLYQHQMASDLYELAQKIEESKSVIQKFMSQELDAHWKSTQASQSMMLATLVHLSDHEKKSKSQPVQSAE